MFSLISVHLGTLQSSWRHERACMAMMILTFLQVVQPLFVCVQSRRCRKKSYKSEEEEMHELG